MDNELDALERAAKEKCENCRHWYAFSVTTGFCRDANNWHDVTFHDTWCDEWKKKE